MEIIEIPNYSFKDKDKVAILNNEGIKKLSKLPRLKSFEFSSLKFLSGEALVYLAANTNGRIEIMKCEECDNLNDSEMIK